MPDQRSVMKEFRALEQKRQVAGLTPEEAKRHAALRDLVGSEAAPARGGFDVSAAAARLRESLLPAGLRSRPPEAEVPAAPPAGLQEAAPPVELEEAPPREAQPWTSSPEPGQEVAPVEPQLEAASLDAGTAQWPEPVVEPTAEPLVEPIPEPAAELSGEPAVEPLPGPDTAAANQPFEPASLALEPKPQAWNPEAPGYDPDAPYDEEAWIAAGYDPNVAYDWSAYGAGPEDQPAGPAPVEAAPLQAAPAEAEVADAEAAPAVASAPEPAAPAGESLPFDAEAPFDHAKWFGRAAASGAAAPGEAMAWSAGSPAASPDAWLDATAAGAPPPETGEYDELGLAAVPAAPVGLEAIPEVAPASAWPEEPGAPPVAPTVFGEYDELAAAPAAGAAPELEAESAAGAGEASALPFDAASVPAVEAGAPPEGYEFLAPSGEAAAPMELAGASVEVAPAPEPPEELPGGPAIDMGVAPQEWQAEAVLDQGFQLASDGSFGMLEPVSAPAAQAWTAPQPVPAAGPVEEGWSSPPALDLAAPFERQALTPAEPMAAWSPEPEGPQAVTAPTGEIIPPLDLGQPVEAVLPPAAGPFPDEELPTLEVEEVLEEVAEEPVQPPLPLDFGPPVAEPAPAEAASASPEEPSVAAEEPLLVPVEAPAASEEPLLVPVAPPPPAFTPAGPLPPPPAATASPPPLPPVAPPPAPAPPAATAPAPVADAPAGQSRVVVHTVDGQVRRGLLSGAGLAEPELVLAPQVSGSPERIPTDTVKAIFFMMAPGETAPPPAGRKVRVTFRDGRQVAGYSPDFQEGTVGFFIFPADTRTNTARIWVYQAAVRQVALS